MTLATGKAAKTRPAGAFQVFRVSAGTEALKSSAYFIVREPSINGQSRKGSGEESDGENARLKMASTFPPSPPPHTPRAGKV